MNLAEQIAYTMRSLRKQRNLTQAELAERMGIAQMTISHIERGVQDASLETLDAFIRALKIQPYDLFNFEIDGKKHTARAKNHAEAMAALAELPDEDIALVATLLKSMAQHRRGQL